MNVAAGLCSTNLQDLQDLQDLLVEAPVLQAPGAALAGPPQTLDRSAPAGG